MDKVVISLGGSIIIPDQSDSDFLKKLADLFKRLSKEYQLFVVCGGGKIARYYIKTGRELSASEKDLDEMGIDVTRLNARLLQLSLKNAAISSIPRTEEECSAAARPGKVAIMGGTTPGHTTDCVSATLAELVGAKRIINATSVDAVYSNDPKTVKSAEKYSHLTFQTFKDLTMDGHGAGRSGVFDTRGCDILLRSRIIVNVVSGRDLEDMENAIRGREIKGTVVSD